jgi:Protein of unknown function (DUF2867)
MATCCKGCLRNRAAENTLGRMNKLPYETTAPKKSRVESLLPGAYFQDAWAIAPADQGLDALGQFLRVAERTPWWIDTLMSVRNRVVGFVGLKNLGGLSQVPRNKRSTEYVEGDRVGIFTLISKTDDEVLLGDDDNHLKVVVSIHKGAPAVGSDPVVTVTTVVHVKNWLGRLYMVPVAPAHRVIARAMVKTVGNAA